MHTLIGGKEVRGRKSWTANYVGNTLVLSKPMSLSANDNFLPKSKSLILQ